MAADPSIDLSGWSDEQLAQARSDVLRGMVKSFAEALIGCGGGRDLRRAVRAAQR